MTTLAWVIVSILVFILLLVILFLYMALRAVSGFGTAFLGGLIMGLGGPDITKKKK